MFAALWKKDLARARSLVFSFLVTKQVIKIVVAFLLSRYKWQIERLQERLTDALTAHFFPPAKKNEKEEKEGEEEEEEKKNEEPGGEEEVLPDLLYPNPESKEYERLKVYLDHIPNEMKAAENDTEALFLDSLVHYG